MEEIARGAEAIIYRDGGHIIKLRPPKKYRNPKIDAALRKQRTRKEVKVLATLTRLGLPGPQLIDSDEVQGRIVMSEIQGAQLKESLDADPVVAAELGRMVAVLHDADIVHGDLTTSNVMRGGDGALSFIDFGLAQHSTKVEDKAVDIHLLRQSLKSKHFRVEERAWQHFLEGYRPKDRDAILSRLEEVERRGRNKT